MIKRNPYFDVVKAIAMLLVVMGYSRWAYGCQVGNPTIDNFIVGMNMPLFFMISGYFSANIVKEGDWSKLGQHLVGYFWPLAVVSCFFSVLSIFFCIEGADKGIIGCAGRNFFFSAWYLWCLAICLIVTFLSARLPKIPFFAILVGIYCILPFLKGVWYVGNVRALFPHFVFGLFVLRKRHLWENRLLGMVCLILYLLVAIISGSFRKNGLSFYNGATEWSAFVADPFNIVLLIARIVLGILGSIGILWLVDELIHRCSRSVKLCATFGKTTLGVYIFHQWILERCVEHISIDPSFLHTFCFAVFLFVGCHYLTVMLKSTPCLRRLIWGLWWRK